MTAAYDAISLLSADDLVDDDDRRFARVPAPPASGVKTIVAPPPVSAEPMRIVESRDRAFRALYEAHSSFVWRNLRRLGVYESDVEDKLQEVFVVAHRRWAEFVDPGHGPRAWLFQIVLRVASDARRHRRRHPVDADGGVAQDRQSIEPPQLAELDRREKLGRLDRALDTIELGRRVVLVLHEIEQMTAPEIARTLELPLNTVYSRLRVARVELDEALRLQEDGR